LKKFLEDLNFHSLLIFLQIQSLFPSNGISAQYIHYSFNFMRFKELIYGDKQIDNPREIEKILERNNFDWLIDSEIENAKIEIKNNTLIWNGGDYYSGFWYYGIFKNGNFYGTFENGIFENGNFYGKFLSGIKLI
jgi:hypothetical protein